MERVLPFAQPCAVTVTAPCWLSALLSTAAHRNFYPSWLCLCWCLTAKTQSGNDTILCQHFHFHPMKELKNAESQLLWWDMGNCFSDFSHCILALLFIMVGLWYHYFCFNYCTVFRKNSYLLFFPIFLIWALCAEPSGPGLSWYKFQYHWSTCQNKNQF